MTLLKFTVTAAIPDSEFPSTDADTTKALLENDAADALLTEPVKIIFAKALGVDEENLVMESRFDETSTI